MPASKKKRKTPEREPNSQRKRLRRENPHVLGREDISSGKTKLGEGNQNLKEQYRRGEELYGKWETFIEQQFLPKIRLPKGDNQILEDLFQGRALGS